MATDWNNLRPWNGSREKGFEELCCQVAAGESYPIGSTFIRKGTPDAGVECYWTLPGGDEHAWQAKFFTSPPNRGQWEQIDDSVRTAIVKHPRLIKYTLCMPIDRPDARVKGQKSFLKKWNERVAIWKKFADKRKMVVEFEFWGDHELTSRLNREENRGRYWFWFTREQFTLEWFHKNLTTAIENAGERYTPILHVDLPISKYFAALGRTARFHDAINALYQEIRKASSSFAIYRLPAEIKEAAEKVSTAVDPLCKCFDTILLPTHEPGRMTSLDQINWERLKQGARPLLDLLNQLSGDLLQRILDKQQLPGKAGESSKPSVREFEEANYYCRQLRNAISDLVEFCDGTEATVANRPALLLVGDAGQGKTHLLCDIAEKDLREIRPRILLHGSHFTDGEPWSQIVRILGLNCSTDEFLGALEAAGRAYNSRILILIDAVNEGEGRRLWEKHLPGMLAALDRYPWIGIAVSVRTSYEAVIIPSHLVPSRLARVVHRGFEEHEYEAVNRFFVHYAIQPTVPLLVPEFTNPLFLKLFCQGIKSNGWKQVPLGLRGITAILNMFLNSVNGKLSKPDRMDYDRLSNPVQKAIEGLVRLMAKSDLRWVSRDQAFRTVNEIHPVTGHERSLFQNLVAEGVLTENRVRTKSGHTDVVSFAYERFGDHLLSKYLIDTFLNRKSPKKSFGPRTKFGKMLKAEWVSSWHAGIIEALSVQLPEVIGKELFQLAPHAAEFYPVRNGFVKSLVWRDCKAFTKATFKQIDELFQYRGTFEEVLNAALTVAPVPEHPLNADKLHEVLSKPSMAERDAWWSTFLHGEWKGNRAVSRLIDWTWGESDKTSLPETVVLLTGTTLAWFLTASNRFLRDRATKALVKLFDNRLILFHKLLQQFWNVNDSYVLERLLAVGYGCAMRAQDTNGLADLTAEACQQVFRETGIIPQILTRDYARGIVEVAIYRGVVPAGSFLECQPPYKSEWPNMKIPSEKTLEKWGEWKKDMPDPQWAQREIYSSVIESGMSDFSRYVLDDLELWTDIPLGTSPPRTIKKRVEDFMLQLEPLQSKALKEYQTVSEFVQFLRRVPSEEQVRHIGHKFTEEDLDAVMHIAENKVIDRLKKEPVLVRVFEKVVKPYIQEPHRYQRSNQFDETLARRWMIQRIIDYGWTTDLFGEFDRTVNRWDQSGRSAQKPERIGKKYQWLAYHELLARLADNFYMWSDRFSDKNPTVYTGPWKYGSVRDIDPSVILRNTPSDDEKAGKAWWSPVIYATWQTHSTNIEWLKNTADLPQIEHMLTVKSPEDRSDWLVLDTHVTWRQPERPGRTKYEESRRNLWFIIQSYLIRRVDAAKFFQWAKRQDFMNRRMPESGHFYHSFLGEYSWAPSFREGFMEEYKDGWTEGWSKPLPAKVLVTCLEFLKESSGYDCSIDETFRIKLPAPPIFQGMKLRWNGSEGECIDSKGELVSFDPSVKKPGPGALLMREEALRQYLIDNDLELFWTLLGEKQLIGGMSRNESGWLQISGVYRLTPKGIVGKFTPEYRTSVKN